MRKVKRMNKLVGEELAGFQTNRSEKETNKMNHLTSFACSFIPLRTMLSNDMRLC
jgi:hypothetical protein